MRKLTSSSWRNETSLYEICPLQYAMSRLDGRWKLVILYYVGADFNRFGMLKKRIPNITDKMLSQQLRELEQDGLLERTVFPQVPPRVDYALTERAKTLIPILDQLFEWGKGWPELPA